MNVVQRTVRSYPYGTTAAHLLGYVGPITRTEWEARNQLIDPDDPAAKTYSSTTRSGRPASNSSSRMNCAACPAPASSRSTPAARLCANTTTCRRSPETTSGCRSISIYKRSPNRNSRPASLPPDRAPRRRGSARTSQQRAALSPSTPETVICWRWRRSRPTNRRISSTASPPPNSASSHRRTTSRRSSTERSRARMRRVRRSS